MMKYPTSWQDGSIPAAEKSKDLSTAAIMKLTFGIANPIPVLRQASMTKHLLLLNTGLLFFIFLLSACLKNDLPSAFYGTWTVVDHKEPGISAMSQNEINSWMGKKIHYSKLKASLPSESCQFPVYKNEPMTIQEFQSEFDFLPAFLGYTGQIIEIINISCKNEDWIVPGNTLIWLEKEKLFMNWDGVFFRLQKQ